MASFEDEILGRIEGVQQEQAEQARIKQEQAAFLEARRAETLARLNQALALGKQAADLLIARNVPTIPIWNHVKIGETEPHLHPSLSGGYVARDSIYELQVTGHGWEVLRSTHIDSNLEYPPETAHYALSTEGSLMSFSRLQLNNYKTRPDSNQRKTIKGIIHTSELQADRMANLVNSEPFKKGVASLIGGLGVYTHTSRS